MVDEITKESWRIAAELGSPVPDALKVYESVLQEFHQGGMPQETVYGTAEFVYEWKVSRNPCYIDFVLLRCSVYGVTPGETLMHEVGEAASLRIHGEPAGTPEKILKESILGIALNLMANLVCMGYPLRTAARMAQTRQKYEAHIVTGHKASTLEKYYTERVRQTGAEQRIKESRAQQSSETLAEWQRIADALPPASDPGNRRD